MHAENIVKGIPYAETNYVYNVDTALYGPKAYPPVFPIMLAPVIAIWGINLKALKFIGVICFLAFLIYYIYKIIPKNFPLIHRICLIILVGFYPVFAHQMNTIMSDIPFLAICTISLVMVNDHINSITENHKENLAKIFMTGFVIYLAYGTRSIGLCLLPTIFFLDIFRNKTISRSTILILLTALLLIFLQSIIITETSSYLDQLPKSFDGWITILSNSLVYYFSCLTYLFQFKSQILQDVVFLIILEFSLISIINQIKNGITSIELFSLFYFGYLLLWPSFQGLRFLLPIIPFYFLYFLEGFQFVSSKCKKVTTWIPKIAPFFLLACILFYNFQGFSNTYSNQTTEIEKPETQGLFDAVRSQTKSNDLIVFFKPRVLALYTNRKSVAVAVPTPNKNTFERMKDLGVTYVIVRNNYLIEYQPEMTQFILQNFQYFQLVYHNSEFQMFRFSY